MENEDELLKSFAETSLNFNETMKANSTNEAEKVSALIDGELFESLGSLIA